MSRQVSRTRGIVLTAFSAAVAVSLAACTPPMPPDVKAALAESQITCTPGAATAAVPEVFAGAMDVVGQALTGACPDETLTEVPAGEAAGITVVDSAPTPDMVEAVSADFCSGDPAIVVPAFAYPVAMSYNIIGLEGLVMTPQIVAGILNGTITRWDDPALVAANEGYDLTNLPPIDLISVESPQGSVLAMTSWLKKVDPQAWTDEPTGSLKAGRKVSTAADLLAELSAVEGSIAVLPTVQAYGASLGTASLPVTPSDGSADVVIATDDTQAAKIGAAATSMAKDDAGNITVAPAVGGNPVEGMLDTIAAKIVVPDGEPIVGWPVLGFAHAIVCDSSTDPVPLNAAQYLVRMAGQGSLEAYGVTPLPEPIRVATFVPLRVEVTDPSADPVATN